MNDGRKTAWTPERKATQAERMRVRFSDPEQRRVRSESQKAIMAKAELRERQSGIMRRLNARMKTDPELKIANHTGQIRSFANPARIAKHSARMKRTWAERPDMRDMARQHCAGLDHAANAEKRWAKARGGAVPVGSEQLYQALRRKVGSKEAFRMVRDEAARAT